MRAKPLAWWFCFSAPHMWTGLVEVSPTSFPNSKTTDRSSVGRGITIAETPKVESSQKPRVDSGGDHSLETENCRLTIVRVIFIFFITSYWPKQSCGAVILYILLPFRNFSFCRMPKQAPCPCLEMLLEKENVVKIKLVVACHILGFHLWGGKKHMYS